MTIRITILATAAITLAIPAHADCKSDIQAMLKSMEASSPYHVDMTMVSGGQTSKMSADVIMPHSMSMKGEDMNMVMTPNGVWMAQGGGPLKKMPDTMKESIQDMIKQGMNLGIKAVDKVECPGNAAFEGGSYNLYKYEAKANFMGIDTFSKVSMYINGDDKPEWMVVDGEAMGIKSMTTQKLVFSDAIAIADPQ